ncbi:MAG: hypothetical protein HEQ29_12855 [Dolichospermum sp. LBC05a]|nr:MAG: hypothetical protein HEQ29_12855 [Dolichospermum sp. LBC05a]
MVKSKVTNNSKHPHQSTTKTAATKPKTTKARATEPDDYDFEETEFEIDP